MYKLPSVLIVDDDQMNIELIKNILKRLHKYNIVSVNNGKDALEKLEETDFSLILLDIVMPDMDGFEVAHKIKTHPTYKLIPLIFLTANTDSNDIKKGFELGAKDYITKPFNLQELIVRVDTHIELYHHNKKLKEKLDENSILLEQYKNIVDESDIVSKTNTRGIITYVNKKFIEISGYSKEELLGRPHNIVRHTDMSTKVFNEMWKILKSKNIWRGEVKNLKKDGGYYVVESTLMPILDAQGNIIEYVGIRHDITDIYNLNQEIENTQKEVIFTLGAVGESRSKETGKHVKRVAEYSFLLGKLYGLDENECNLIRNASPMHDIGKVAISDAILNKPSGLDRKEFEIIKTHSKLGFEMLKHSQRPILKAASTIALEHHEKFDGTGYPNKKQGENIHIYGRITALSDVFDALGTNRVYKEAWELDDILELIKEESGKHFDPKLVLLFLDNLPDFLDIREKFKEI